jgi:hypothetical protein
MTEPPDLRPGTPTSSERACDREGDVLDFSGQRVGTGPCVDRNGRPIAHTAYVWPSRRNRLLWFSGAASFLAAVAMVALFFLAAPARSGASGGTLRTVLAPGPNSSPHSLETTDCVQCHREAEDVEDVRCERCHDSGISGRLTNAAHVFAGSADLRAAVNAPMVPCVTCHVEHRGSNVDLSDVDDRECGTCHRIAPGSTARLATFARHPEFAIVRAGVESGSGLKWFNHADHLTKVAQKFQNGSCNSCHARAPGAPAFEPVSFDRHCATCHEGDLESASAGTFAPALATAFGALPAGVRIDDDLLESNRKVLTGLKHADPWLLRSVQSFRRVLDPVGLTADRLALDRQVAQAELETMERGSGGAWLDPSNVERLRALLAPSRSTVDPETAARQLTEQLKKSLSAFPAEWANLVSPSAQPGQPVTPAQAATAVAPSPREGLRRLLEATIVRARAGGDADLEARATALVGRLSDASGAGRTPSVEAASAIGLDVLLTELAKIRDPGGRAELSELMELQRLAARSGAQAIDPTAFDQHRQQTLALLAQVRQSLQSALRNGDPAARSLAARAGSLERLILATPYSLGADDAAALERFYRPRHLDRAVVDVELARAGLLSGEASNKELLRRVERFRDALRDRLPQLKRRLASHAVAAAPQVASADARAAITTLLGTVESDPAANMARKSRCTMCHDLTPAGDQLAPIRTAGQSLMPHAWFSHDAHVNPGQDNCETCHTNIRTSRRANDVNLPSVASCQTCHGPGKSAERFIGCEACHSYHVAPSKALRWQP